MHCYFSFWILNTYKVTPFLPVFSFPCNEQNNSSSLCLLHISSHRLLRFTCSYRFLLLPKFFYTKMMWLRFFVLMIKRKLCGNLRHFQTHIKWAHPLVKYSLSPVWDFSAIGARPKPQDSHFASPQRFGYKYVFLPCQTWQDHSYMCHRPHLLWSQASFSPIYFYSVFFFFLAGKRGPSCLGVQTKQKSIRDGKESK